MARIEFDAARVLSEPVTYTDSAGREWTFPADLIAGEFLGFMIEHGEAFASANVPHQTIDAWYRLLFAGEHAEFVGSVSLREAGWLAQRLWFHYLGVRPLDAEEGVDVDPPAQA